MELFSRHRATIDLVVLDVTMPGRDGPAALEAMRELAPDVPAVLTSGYSDHHVDTASAVFLSKPYDASELTRVVGALLEDPEPGRS